MIKPLFLYIRVHDGLMLSLGSLPRPSLVIDYVCGVKIWSPGFEVPAFTTASILD